jgi:hypothetical protein
VDERRIVAHTRSYQVANGPVDPAHRFGRLAELEKEHTPRHERRSLDGLKLADERCARRHVIVLGVATDATPRRRRSR